MAQTQAPANFWKNGHMRGYTPASAVYPGDIVVIGNQCFLCSNAIAASTLGSLHVDGTWQVPKDTSVFADGDPVFWNATGSPNVGTASTGSATSTPAGGVFMGVADGAALTGDQYVYVRTPIVADIASSGPQLSEVTIAALGTTQNSTPTAAQLIGGLVTQTGATGAGTVTLPTGTLMSAAMPRNPVVGTSFQCVFANLGGSQTLTITGATGMTVLGTAAVGTGKFATLTFVNTAANTWSVYCVVSA